MGGGELSTMLLGDICTASSEGGRFAPGKMNHERHRRGGKHGMKREVDGQGEGGGVPAER